MSLATIVSLPWSGKMPHWPRKAGTARGSESRRPISRSFSRPRFFLISSTLVPAA